MGYQIPSLRSADVFAVVASLTTGNTSALRRLRDPLSPLFCHRCKTGHSRDIVTAMTWEGISSFVFLVKNVFTETKSTNRNFTMNACFIMAFLIFVTKEILGKKNFTNSEDVQDYKGKKKR